jgi:hypothetical protein
MMWKTTFTWPRIHLAHTRTHRQKHGLHYTHAWRSRGDTGNERKYHNPTRGTDHEQTPTSCCCNLQMSTST